MTNRLERMLQDAPRFKSRSLHTPTTYRTASRCEHGGCNESPPMRTRRSPPTSGWDLTARANHDRQSHDRQGVSGLPFVGRPA
jgi:hypothetical protein